MPRIAVIYPENNTSTIPSLVALLRAMVQDGQVVDYFCKQNNTVLFNENGINVIPLREYFSPGTLGWKLCFVVDWLLKILKHSFLCRYQVALAVDPWGLLLAYPAFFFRSIPVVYFSLEIYPEAELKGVFIRYLKKCERILNRRASFTIIQDAERASLLRIENQLPDNHKILFLPNSAGGAGSGQKTDYLAKKYTIPEMARVVLYAGSVYPYACHLEVAQSAHTWGEKFRLVIHSGRQPNNRDMYVEALSKEVDGRKVYMGVAELNDTEYDALVRSAHIGLALYVPKDRNILHIGLSSGKVSRYLQCGVPIIVSNLPSLSNLVGRYACGLIISDISELKAAIETIDSDYERFSSNAVKCFNEILDPRRYLDEICSAITGITRS